MCRKRLAILFKKFLKKFHFRLNIDYQVSDHIYIILSVRMYH